MAHNHSADKWTNHSGKWASSVQDVTRSPCRELLDMTVAQLPVTESSTFFDNGAGSGMMTSVIVERFPNNATTAADVSSGMIDTLKQNDWKNVKALVADACDLRSAGLENAAFTHSLGTFFLPFVPDPSQAVREMTRVTEPGGVVALATWHKDTPSWVEPWQKAVRASVDPNWTAPEVFHPKTTDPEAVRGLFTAAGLADVEVRVVACPHPKKESVEHAVDEFIGMGNPSVDLLTKDFSREQIEREIRPEFIKAYAERYDGVEEPQKEWAVLAVGKVKK